ncbi:MAG: bifunctional phosphoribosyl-AMP cyclohydrolase/phosphoribosyl-ATP diphosphatase HisIE [Campylobacterota bacterium]
MKSIDWNKTPLVPAIVQDSQTNEVLMLAYQDKQAYELSLQTGFAHYYSRSKKRLWKKGESSGHTQQIEKLKIDCDQDSVLMLVKQNGVACHTGAKSCFFTDVTSGKVEQKEVDTAAIYSVIDTLYHTILDKKDGDPKQSYTAQLINRGENTILKKIVEEAGELCFAVKDGNEDEIIYETADLVYHCLVALGYKQINPDRVKSELKRRFGISGIAEKESRKEK